MKESYSANAFVHLTRKMENCKIVRLPSYHTPSPNPNPNLGGFAEGNLPLDNFPGRQFYDHDDNFTEGNFPVTI